MHTVPTLGRSINGTDRAAPMVAVEEWWCVCGERAMPGDVYLHLRPGSRCLAWLGYLISVWRLSASPPIYFTSQFNRQLEV